MKTTYKIWKKSLKFIIIFALVFVLGNVAVYTYAKITPKLQIKSANSLALYDNQSNLFFKEVVQKNGFH